VTAPNAARPSAARWLVRIAVAASGIALGFGLASGTAQADTLLGKTGEAVQQTTKSAVKVVHHSTSGVQAAVKPKPARAAQPRPAVAHRSTVRKVTAPVRTQVKHITRATQAPIVHRTKKLTHVAQRPVVKHVTKQAKPVKSVTTRVVKHTARPAAPVVADLSTTLVQATAATSQLATGVLTTAVPSLVLPLVDQVTTPLLPIVDQVTAPLLPIVGGVVPGIRPPLAPPLALTPPPLLTTSPADPASARSGTAKQTSSPYGSSAGVTAAAGWLLSDPQSTPAPSHRHSVLHRLVANSSLAPVLAWAPTLSFSQGLAPSGEAGSGAAGSVGFALAACALVLAALAGNRQISGALRIAAWTAPRHPGFSPD
jgi:hypothetical protein